MKSQNFSRILILICINFFLFSCNDASTHSEPPYEGPPKDHIISVERAQEMFDAYSQRRVPIIQEYEDKLVPDQAPFTPTRYAEYDLKTIKQYIAYIEHEAMQANVNINTLRFYLSNYPNSDKFPNGDSVKYPRRNSLFVVPTMDYKGTNVTFSIEERGGTYTAVPIKKPTQIKEKNQNKADSTGQMNEAGFFMSNSTTVQGGGTTSLILNDSQLAPPPGTGDLGNDI